jgi:predicted aldo/keto reductase-like oxidoreductase
MFKKRDLYSRRKFLSSSITGFTATAFAGAFPRAVLAQQTDESSNEPQNEIIHRELGKTGIKLPIVGMGVMNANNPELIPASYDLGVRHFDTAALYQYGRNEQMVGHEIKKMGVRDKVVIATKILHRVQRDILDPKKAKAELIKALDSSLTRLQTDYVDILYIHSIYTLDDLTNSELLEALSLVKEQGKVRAIGVSTHRIMTDLLNECARTGFFDVVLTTINVSMADDTDLINAIENAAQKGIGVVAMKTQAGGSRFSPENIASYGSSVAATAALKWVLRNKNISMAIPGYDNYEHMREDFSVAYGLDYTEEEKALLTDGNITIGMGFCRQCQQCLASCPRGVDIPNLMRIHMYASRYANFHQARTTLNNIPVQKGLKNCDSCAQCTANCARSINIPRQVDELKLIYGHDYNLS